MNLTDYVMFAFLGLLLLFEVFVIWRGRETISANVWRHTVKYPLIPFLFGLLMGHFFW